MAIQLPIVSTFDKRGVKQANKSIGGLRNGVLGLGAAIGGAFAIRGIVNFTKSTVTSASDLQESLNAVQVAFGDTGDAVAKLGEDAADRLGVAQSAFNGAAVRFSAFAERVVGEGGDVAGFIDDVTVRATDFASVFNIEVAEALQVFQSGLAGEAEPLKRFGINLLQSEVQAFALREGIIGVGESMTEAEKVQARYGLLMEETDKTAGDFENTSDSLANAQRRLNANFEDIRAEIGNALIPAFEGFTAYILENVVPVLTEFFEDDFPQMLDDLESRFDAFQPAIERMEDSIREAFSIDPDVGLLEGFLDKLTEVVTSEDFALFMESLIEGFAELLPALVDLLPLLVEFYQVVVPALIQLLPGVTDLVRGLVGIFGNEKGGLAFGIGEALDKLFSLDENLRLFPGAADAVRELVPKIQEFFTNMGLVISGAAENWPAAFEGMWINIKLVFSRAFGGIIESFTLWGEQVIGYLFGLGVQLYETALQTMQSFWNGLIEKFVEIAEWFKAKPGEIKGFFENPLEILSQIGADIFTGLWNGLKSIWPRISSWVSDKVESIKSAFRDAMKIGSPSKVFEGYGKNIVEGLLIGLDSLSPNVDTSVSGLVSEPSMGSVPMGGGRGGDIYVTVNAGMGTNGPQVGEEIVAAIKRYERSSGRVFASA